MSSESSGRRVPQPFAGLLFLLALLGAVVPLAGCGKKGPPEPPLRFVPAPAKDLTVSQQGSRLLLGFSYPKLTPGGQALGGVAEVEVWEVKRPAAPVVPPAAVTATTTATATTKPPATPTAGTTPPAAPPATPPATPAPAKPPAAPAPATAPATPAAPTGPPPLDPREFKPAATLRLKLKGPEVGAATQGDRIVIALPLPEPLPEKPGLLYYAVRTSGPNGDRSEYSNQAVLLPRTPPQPPAETQVKPRGDGVEVTWTQPAGAPAMPAATPGAPAILGYNVYRRDSQVKGFGPPLHPAAAGDRAFIDTAARFGQSYIYAVTTVLTRTPLVESAIKSEVEIKYVDRFAPPAPREPVALVEAGRVRLVWRGSEAPDLAGYRVYRLDLREVKGEYRRLTESAISDVQYTDSTVKAGTSYVYRITAVDQAGNESDPAEVRATAQ